MSDVKATLEERGKRYGLFLEHAQIAQKLQDGMRDSAGWSELAPDQKQALTVIADKIARMLNGDPDYDDNWRDIAGYAQLVLDRLLGQGVYAAKVPPPSIDPRERFGATTAEVAGDDSYIAPSEFSPLLDPRGRPDRR